MMAFQWRPPNPPKSPEVEGIETAKALGVTIPQYAGLTAGGRGHRRRHDRAQGGALSRPAAPTAAPTCIDRRPPFPLSTHTAGALSVRSDEDLLEEAAHALVAGAVEDGLRRADLEDFALVHEDDAVGHLSGEAHLVSGDEHRHPLPRHRLHDPP